MQQQLVFLVCILMVFVACSGSKQISVISENGHLESTKTNRNAFLKEATFYGLQKDHFPIDVAHDLVEENSNWVVKCPICDNVKRGFEMYTAQNANAGKTSISKANLSLLKSGDTEVRKIALRDLVDRYVQQYYSVLAMSEKQREDMEQQLKEGRKTGMAVANGGEGFFCASCDGACHIKD